MARRRVFVDTNVILEAFRTGCWPAITSKWSIETVEKCVEEALTGDPHDPGRIPVEQASLMAGLAACHAVRKQDIASLALSHPACQGLDDGELHLLSLLHAKGWMQDVQLLISTADKAAIVATGTLGGLDSLVSLEHLAQSAGVARAQLANLARHYRVDWLDGIKVKVRFGIIP